MTSEGQHAGQPAEATSGGGAEPFATGFPPDSDGRRTSGRAAVPADDFPNSYGPPPQATPNGGSPFVVPAVPPFGQAPEVPGAPADRYGIPTAPPAGPSTGSARVPQGSARVPQADDGGTLPRRGSKATDLFSGPGSPGAAASPGAAVQSPQSAWAPPPPANSGPVAEANPFEPHPYRGAGGPLNDQQSDFDGFAPGSPTRGRIADEDSAGPAWGTGFGPAAEPRAPEHRGPESFGPGSFGPESRASESFDLESRGSESFGLESPASQSRSSESFGLESRGGESFGLESRGQESFGLESRGPGSLDPESGSGGRPPGLSAFGDQRVRVPGATLTGLPDAAQPGPADPQSPFGGPARSDTPSSFGDPSRSHGDPPRSDTPPSFGDPTRSETPSSFGDPSRSFGDPSRSDAPPSFGDPARSETPSSYGDPSRSDAPPSFGNPTRPETPTRFGIPDGLPLRSAGSASGGAEILDRSGDGGALPRRVASDDPTGFGAQSRPGESGGLLPRAEPPATRTELPRRPSFGGSPAARQDSPFDAPSPFGAASPFSAPGPLGDPPAERPESFGSAPPGSSAFGGSPAARQDPFGRPEPFGGSPAGQPSMFGGQPAPSQEPPTGRSSVFSGSPVPGQEPFGGPPAPGQEPFGGSPTAAQSSPAEGDAGQGRAGPSSDGRRPAHGSPAEIPTQWANDAPPSPFARPASGNSTDEVAWSPFAEPAPGQLAEDPLRSPYATPGPDSPYATSGPESPYATSGPDSPYATPGPDSPYATSGPGQPRDNGAGASPYGHRQSPYSFDGPNPSPFEPADDGSPYGRNDGSAPGTRGRSSEAFGRPDAAESDRPSSSFAQRVPGASLASGGPATAPEPRGGGVPAPRDPADGPVKGTARPVSASASVPMASRVGPAEGDEIPPPVQAPQARVYGRPAQPAEDDSPAPAPVSPFARPGDQRFGEDPLGGASQDLPPLGPRTLPPGGGPVRATASARVALPPAPSPVSPPYNERTTPPPPPDNYGENTTDMAGRSQAPDKPYVPAPALPTMHARPPLVDGFPAPPEDATQLQSGVSPERPRLGGVFPGPGGPGPGSQSRATVTPPGPDETSSWPGPGGAVVEPEQGRFDQFKPDAEAPPKPETPHVRMLPILLGVILGGALLLGAAFGLVRLISGGSDSGFTANAGDCVKRSGDQAVKATCGDPNTFTVVSKVDTKEQCPDPGQPYVLNPSSNGKTQVLCLKPSS